MESTFADLYNLLVYLSGPIGAAAWMLFVSNAVKNWRTGNLDQMSPADDEIAVWVRARKPLTLQALVFLVAVGIPGLAAIALAYVPLAWIERAQPAYATTAMLLTIWMVQQVWYQATKPDPKEEGAAPVG